MLGIGLGAAMTAFNESQRLRQADEDRKRRLVLQQREDEEYNRAKKMRDEIDAIGIQTKKDFDTQVASGKRKADDFDTFWKEQALPKLKETYLTQGNFEAADRLQKWGEDADVKAGAKLSLSAMWKASNGDYSGALDDALKVGEKKGYIDHNYELVGKTEIIDPKTKNVVGYRLNVKTPDGETVQQDIAAKDIPRVVSTLINPQAAWESYLKKQEQSASDARELKNYEAKKKIDRLYSGDQQQRSKAIENLRKRFNGGLDGQDAKFDDMPRDQQESLINGELSLQAGAGSPPGIGIGAGAPSASAGPAASAPPAQKVVVDKMTGRTVNPAAVPGLAAPVKTAPQPASQPQAQNETPQVRTQYMIQEAQDAISNGERPTRVADQLRQAGIPEDQWPPTVAAAVQKEAETRGLGMVR